MTRPDDILLVDGYNIIGAWPVLERLKEYDLEEARDKLLTMLADYQGYSGMTVYVIFDAHQVPGLGATYKQNKLIVVYTKEKETADECIERHVVQLYSRRRNLYVATSDLIEQHVAFGKGALRISARELLVDVEQSRKQIEHKLREEKPGKRNSLDGNLSLEVRSQLERLRRGGK
ncbi:NYN domain-containing protein [Paenibacillus sp. NEAU-GSW1]|uniref:NYN domain-containing protein n=1 Tax=Paenibacillus sp. NEAU-GSW1 TaxID=2682486 RepID=UPI0012E1A3CB|nr:NYN domain-containing protein [Paenibacillus sp. NEAU-GSW1]MUT68169.1 NYN domain-containing protein [Paenibacillus sp. NEAU-GSW1]